MYVCICNAITDTQIKEAQSQGYVTMSEITKHLGVGNCCGRCISTAEEILAEAQPVQHYIPSFQAAIAHTI